MKKLILKCCAVFLTSMITSLVSCSGIKKPIEIDCGEDGSSNTSYHPIVSVDSIIAVKNIEMTNIYGIITMSDHYASKSILNFTNLDTHKKINITTSFDGDFNTMISKGEYELAVITDNSQDTINIGEFNFKKGEIRNIEINLTDPITIFETYTIRFQFKNKRKLKIAERMAKKANMNICEYMKTKININ